jgi:hypothetical protein
MKTKVSSQQTPFILVNHAAFLQAPVTLFNPMVRVDEILPLSPASSRGLSHNKSPLL